MNTKKNYETIAEEEHASGINKFLPTKNPLNTWGIVVLISTFILMIGSAYLVYFLQRDFTEINTARMNTTWGYAFFILASALFLYRGAFFIYNLVLYFKYKPIESVSNEELPTCTVIRY